MFLAEHIVSRTDFIEDEWIQDLLAFEFPPNAPACTHGDQPLEFTKEENLTMLRLPRKECQSSRFPSL